MATAGLHQNSRKPIASTSSLLSHLVLSLLCLASLFLGFSLLQNDVIASPSLTYSVLPYNNNNNNNNNSKNNCNYGDGQWIYDPTVVFPPHYDHTCKEIFKGWNCIISKKSNAFDIFKWRWKPNGCHLWPFDPRQFLESFRDTNIGFVGDSLNRNMFVSFFCSLRQVSSEVKKWRPVGSDRGFTFVNYNLSIAYHRTNLLARYGRWSASSNRGTLESLGYKEGYRIDVDLPEKTWAEAPSFHDVLIFNTGHWWWPPLMFDPVKSPMIFFKKGAPVIPPIPPDVGLDMVLEHMVQFVEEKARPGAIFFFRTQSPRHTEGGESGSCSRFQPLVPREVEDFFSLKNNKTDKETRLVNQHLHRALKGSSFHTLDITHMSEFRADAHPYTTGRKRHHDCMHWCLPGVTDTWNDLFIQHMYNIRGRNRIVHTFL